MEYTLIRAKRKTIAVQITKEGEVVVRAPRLASRRCIDAFLREKEAWIQAARQSVRARMTRYAPVVLQDGAPLPYLGGTLTLRAWAHADFALRGNSLYFPQAAALDDLIRFLRAQAETLLRSRIAFYCEKMGVAISGMRLSSAQARYGSCNVQDKLNLSWRLIFFPPAQVDYIVVHELSHVRHKDHSAAFWNEVAAVLPDYKLRQKRLREDQGLMYIL
ncbi:MAG: SprT family zinc-dependent metalloprotease [Clostridia bacterium]|nr:SprT family zinc-dependent metalloprotease [Clostridia bacterium]